MRRSLLPGLLTIVVLLVQQANLVVARCARGTAVAPVSSALDAHAAHHVMSTTADPAHGRHALPPSVPAPDGQPAPCSDMFACTSVIVTPALATWAFSTEVGVREGVAARPPASEASLDRRAPEPPPPRA